MAERLVIFDGESLVKLLVHYTHAAEDIEGGVGGRVPLDSEVVAIGFNKFIPRWVQVLVRSGQWDEKLNPTTGKLDPLHIRYEGQRVLRWSDKRTEAKDNWTQDRLEDVASQ